jgi:hypothetical protein
MSGPALIAAEPFLSCSSLPRSARDPGFSSAGVQALSGAPHPTLAFVLGVSAVAADT